MQIKSTRREISMINGFKNTVNTILTTFCPVYASLLLFSKMYMELKIHFEYIMGNIGMEMVIAMSTYINIMNAY